MSRENCTDTLDCQGNRPAIIGVCVFISCVAEPQSCNSTVLRCGGYAALAFGNRFAGSQTGKTLTEIVA